MANSLTYKNAGVNLEAARAVVEDIARLRRRTEQRRRLCGAFGGFASAYDLSGYHSPVILTTCDGIGTKIIPLLEHDLVETAGIDLVAMNVNDILTSNAEPILFLDYIGIGHIHRERIARLITGMTGALETCNCILAGGETAEMPDLVEEGRFELSGFCVGAAEKSELPDMKRIRNGDAIIGLPSSGFHANGWSLIRRILQQHPNDFSRKDQRELLAPTRIYYPEVMRLKWASLRIKGMAHITGGGLAENLARVLGGNGASLVLPPFQGDAVAKVLAHADPNDAFRAFNMGIGWVLVLDAADVDRALAVLPDGVVLGAVTEGDIRMEVAT